MDSGVNDANQDDAVVGSDYQDRDPITEYWTHLRNKLERKCDSLEDLTKGKDSLRENKKYCKAWKYKVWYYKLFYPIQF